MSRRQITPCEFGQLLTTTLALREDQTRSKPFAAVAACQRLNIDEAWAIPVIAMLNDSVFMAEEWTKAQHNEALDRAFDRAHNRSNTNA